MLQTAHTHGVQAALQRFGIKEAGVGDFLLNAAKATGRMFVGHPDVVLREGRKTFSPGGMLHWKNVLWPTFKGAPVMTWLGRAGTILPMIGAVQAARGKGNPNEGRLSNTLGALGGMVGNAYGFPAGGMVLGPTLGRLGERMGRGVGHMLGSRPDPTAPETAPNPALDPQNLWMAYGLGDHQR